MSRIQEYVRPRSMQEAVTIKADLGNKGFYLAGGTDVLVFTPPSATTAIDIMHLGLHEITSDNESIRLGATALLRDIERDSRTASIADGAFLLSIRETGPWLIRNAATLAGNVCNASPSADSAPMLLALDSSLVLDDESIMPLSDVFMGPHRTALGDRLVTSIRLEPRDRSGYFQKLSRSKSDIAQVNLAVTAQVDGKTLSDVRIAVGSVAPTPVRLRETESSLDGKPLTRDLAAEAVRLLRDEIHPIDDWRATASYRRHAAGVMLSRALFSLAGL